MSTVETQGNIVDVGITRFSLDLDDPNSTVGWAYRSKPADGKPSVEYLVILDTGDRRSFPNLSPQLNNSGGAEQHVFQILVDGAVVLDSLQAFALRCFLYGVRRDRVQQLVVGTVVPVQNVSEFPDLIPSPSGQPAPDVDGHGPPGPDQVWLFSGGALEFPHGDYAKIRQVYGVFPNYWKMKNGDSVLYRKLVAWDGPVYAVNTLAGFKARITDRLGPNPDSLAFCYGTYAYHKDPKSLWP